MTVSSANRQRYANAPPGWPEGHRESDEGDQVDLGEHDKLSRLEDNDAFGVGPACLTA
jgi:hypothetical protein